MNKAAVSLEELVARLEGAMAALTRSAGIRRFYAQLAAEAGVTLERPGYLVLKQLVSDGPARITDLALDHGVEPSTMSRHTKALEDSGLVVKLSDPRDGRVSLAEATSAGRAVVERIEAARHQLLADALSDWDVADGERFVDLFEQFNNAIYDRLDNT